LALAVALPVRPLTQPRSILGRPSDALRVFGARSNEFRSENILDFMNRKNMSLGDLDPLHVYVKHDVELTEQICDPESDGTLDFIR
jgi:hypothetical protein